jgi:hypothetical protein
MSLVDLLHALFVLALRAAGGTGCGAYPVAVLHKQLAAGYMFVAGWAIAVLKNRRLHATANRPVRARLYFPVRHDAIACHVIHRPPLPPFCRPSESTYAFCRSAHCPFSALRSGVCV